MAIKITTEKNYGLVIKTNELYSCDYEGDKIVVTKHKVGKVTQKRIYLIDDYRQRVSVDKDELGVYMFLTESEAKEKFRNQRRAWKWSSLVHDIMEGTK